MDRPWRIEMLGALRAMHDNRVVSRFRTQKTGALLADLAFHPHRSHPRDLLVERLWPEDDPDAGRNKLRQALTSLRRQLEPPGIPAGTVIIADRASVQLNPVAVTTDVAEFEAALLSASRAGSHTERLQCLTEAVELYRGELLPGFFEDWILLERERLAESFHRAADSLIDCLRQAGDLHGALQWARRAVSADPLREEAHCQVMRLLHAVGERAAALRHFGELERILETELAATPSAATLALVASLRDGATVKADGRSQISDVSEREEPPQLSSVIRHLSSALPTGAVTFLLTDIEGSTALWEQTGEAFASALAGHHALLRQVVREHGGHEVKEMGDGFLVAFRHAGDALACAVAGQRELATHLWPREVGAVRVRMALHTGDVTIHEGDYRGLALHRAARMLLAAHGGQILCSETTAHLLRGEMPSETRLVDLGIYRLRGVNTPERLFQVEYDGMSRREFPPPNAEAGFESRLPLQFTRFFGRENEIGRVCDLLGAVTFTPTPSRLVTLTGPGGAGKTRLAIEVAHRAMDAWSGAVWFVPLADLSEGHLILDAVHSALRLPRAPGVDPLEQLTAVLARQPALLILDNFEHLVAEGAPLVRMLLERVPSLTCLVTSRHLLDLAGEREFLVPTLTTPDGESTPEQLSQCESVQLFVNRAQLVRPDFQLTRDNAGAITALCRRLEGIPLALELAAARIQVLTPAQMVTRLEKPLDLLVGRQRDATTRHLTLRGAIDWSYQLLAPDLQRFLARLSVFRGGWTLSAAEAVCEEPRALEHLEHLRRCSLVVTEEVGVDSQGEMRFRMLETLREFAREQLAPEEQSELERRHLEFYLALAEEAEPKLRGPEQVAWQKCLEREHDNLRAAVDGCHAETERRQAGMRLVGALGWFWVHRGHFAEGRQRAERVLSWDDGASPHVLGKVLAAANVLAYFMGDYEAAGRYAEKALGVSREAGDVWGIAYSLFGLAMVAIAREENEQATTWAEECLAFAQEAGDPWLLAHPLLLLGSSALVKQDFERATAYYQESLALSRQAGDRWLTGIVLLDAAAVAQSQGNLEQAMQFVTEQLAIAQELEDTMIISMSLEGFASVATAGGQPARAARFYGAAAALREAIGAPTEAPERARIERAVADARAVLGEDAFAAAWAEGRAMTLEEMIAAAVKW